MPQELLHAAQVVTRLEQVRGEGMPEQVRVDLGVDALAPGPVVHARLYAAATQARAPVADEQCPLVRRRQRAARFLPAGERLHRPGADRHDTVLVALAGDAHRRILHVHVAEIQVGEFGQAEPGRVQELEDRAVAVDERAVSRNLEEPCHAVRIEVLGQAFRAPGCGHRLHRVTPDVLFAQQVTEEGARRG